jgi:hypothetical protein
VGVFLVQTAEENSHGKWGFCTEGCKTAAGNHVAYVHGQIKYTDTRAKCRHLTKLTCKGTMRQVFFRVHRLEIQSVPSLCQSAVQGASSIIVKWINIKRARRPYHCPLRQVSVKDVENCFNEGLFYQKIQIFTQMG